MFPSINTYLIFYRGTSTAPYLESTAPALKSPPNNIKFVLDLYSITISAIGFLAILMQVVLRWLLLFNV